MANFFIQRPIFAWVLAIILMMAGALAILQIAARTGDPTIARRPVSNHCAACGFCFGKLSGC